MTGIEAKVTRLRPASGATDVRRAVQRFLEASPQARPDAGFRLIEAALLELSREPVSQAVSLAFSPESLLDQARLLVASGASADDDMMRAGAMTLASPGDHLPARCFPAALAGTACLLHGYPGMTPSGLRKALETSSLIDI